MIVESWRSLALAALGLVVVALVVFWFALPKLSCPPVPSTETAAVASLHTYLAAQNQFHRTFGRTATFAEFAQLGLIDEAMAKATSPGNPRAGYYFVPVRAEDPEAAGPGGFALCAVPARYGKTGRNTFIIDVTGVVYQKDTGGEPVRTWPDVSDGWIPVGSEG